MKKIGVFLTVIMALMPALVFASQQTDSKVPEQSEQQVSVSFQIDNKNVYGGMERAYKDGYSPTVSGNTARIILPLTSSGTVANNTVIASPNLGDPSSSPFVFNNYEKNVSLAQHTVNGGKNKVQAYYVYFDLPLSSSRMNGSYPVEIVITGKDQSGNPFSQSFTTYVQITDGVSVTDNAPAETMPQEEKPQSKPILIVQSSQINPAPVNAGEEFSAKVVIKNTSTKKAVQNIVFTISSESKGITLLMDSNTVYLSRLGSNKTHTLDLKYKTSSKLETGGHTINIAMSYDDDEATTSTSQGQIEFEVAQPMKLKLNISEIPAEINAGDVLPISLQAINMGRGNIYNARCELNVDGLSSSTTAFFGNIDAGTDKALDMNVFVGTRKQSAEQYGVTNGTIILTYEDENGKEETQSFEVSTSIQKPIISAASEDNKKKPQGQWWITLAIGGALLAGGAWYLLKYKRSKQDESM